MYLDISVQFKKFPFGSIVAEATMAVRQLLENSFLGRFARPLGFLMGESPADVEMQA